MYSFGIPPGQKGWHVYDLEKRRIFTSRDVIFYEDVFPFEHEPRSSQILGQENMDNRLATRPFIEMFNEPAHDTLQTDSPVIHNSL